MVALARFVLKRIVCNSPTYETVLGASRLSRNNSTAESVEVVAAEAAAATSAKPIRAKAPGAERLTGDTGCIAERRLHHLERTPLGERVGRQLAGVLLEIVGCVDRAS